MILAEIAAASSPPPDYTPAAIGLLGTLIGASIGIAFNFFSHREQKRRHVNEKIVEFLRHTDAINAASNDVYTSDFDHDSSPEGQRQRKSANKHRVKAARESLRESKIVLDYVGLTADRLTYNLARFVHESSKAVLATTSLHVEQGASLSFDTSISYRNARNALVAHLTPRFPAPNSPLMLTRRFSYWASRNRHDCVGPDREPPTAAEGPSTAGENRTTKKEEQ